MHPLDVQGEGAAASLARAPGRLLPARPLKPGKGQQHLMRLLELLARIAPASEEHQAQPFLELVRQQRAALPWGATLVLITGSASDALFNELFQARRAGLIPVILLVGKVPGVQPAREKAGFFKIPFYHLLNELDLDQWRAPSSGIRPPVEFMP